ncbi:MAG: hypothetical protein M1389_12050 [Chloroflexi bacterium]|nr:hypothetical protein [Chloroflexota bacterium]
MERDYTVFLHFIGPDGKMVAQHDSQPASATYPTSAWPPGETIVDRHTLKLPSHLAAGKYIIAAGLYDLDTQERVGGPDHAAVFPLTVSECR